MVKLWFGMDTIETRKERIKVHPERKPKQPRPRACWWSVIRNSSHSGPQLQLPRNTCFVSSLTAKHSRVINLKLTASHPVVEARPKWLRVDFRQFVEVVFLEKYTYIDKWMERASKTNALAKPYLALWTHTCFGLLHGHAQPHLCMAFIVDAVSTPSNHELGIIGLMCQTQRWRITTQQMYTGHYSAAKYST